MGEPYLPDLNGAAAFAQSDRAAREVPGLVAERDRLRRQLAYLLDRGDALAAAARHCAHACVPPCPHTRKVAAVLETWDATSDLSRREGAGAGASRERSDPSPSGPGSLASHDTGGV